MLEGLFSPRAVTVVGSTSPGKLGYFLIQQLLEGGFERVYALNPKGQGAFSVPGFKTPIELPEDVDLAIIVSPAETVPEVLEGCGQRGIKYAVIISSGFSEIGKEKEEEELLQIAHQYGMRFVGPNCAGIVNTQHKLFATLETRPPQGVTAFVSQSGALGGAVLSWAEEQGLGFSKFISYGNARDLNELDFLEYLTWDQETKVVALYLESAKNGITFLNALKKLTDHKPVVLIKAGRSQAGKRATLSHTGSLAGSDEVFEAAIRGCGAIRVKGIEEMFDVCKGFSSILSPQGKRLVIVTNSGGPGVLTADLAEELGWEIPPPSRNLTEKLTSSLFPRASLGNPVDLTVEGKEEHFREAIISALESEYDAAIAINVGTPFLDSISLARGISQAYEKAKKPVLVSFLAGKTVADGVNFLRERKMPNFLTGERAVLVLDALWRREKGEKIPQKPQINNLKQKELPPIVLEPQAIKLLEENGIPVPPHRLARNLEEVKEGANQIGFPLVMKVISPLIIHKSEAGGVILDIKDEESLRVSFYKLSNIAGNDFQGVMLYPMLKPLFEALIGLYRDPQFGPLVAFGLGGIYSEILKDISLHLAPVSEEEAGQMIKEIRAFPLLEGARGQKPVNILSLAQLISKTSLLPFIYPQIEEMDMNPVFLFEDRSIVADVRILVRKENKQ